jgi:class 3 adenylate cyclase
MTEAVRRYAVTSRNLTGDGIFALFGAPVAREDHPQRALAGAPANAPRSSGSVNTYKMMKGNYATIQLRREARGQRLN